MGTVFYLWAYISVLPSFFFLDDFDNFYGLKFVNSLDTALYYIYHNPTGIRWLSYLSFLPHIEHWAAEDPYPFKLINIVIHLLNAGLLFLLVRQLGKRLYPEKQATLCAFVISLVWLIHPIHANTVLYAVQRMALLSTTAILSGVIIYNHCLEKVGTPTSHRQTLYLVFVLWFFTLLAITFKENGILLAAVACICHQFFYKDCHFAWYKKLFIYGLPYIALLLLLIIDGRLSYYSRSFTMLERVLSQTFILIEYMHKTLLPNFNSFSLFYDDFKPIRSISDYRFVFSIAFWSCLIALSIKTRKRIPLFSFCILLFLILHSLESSIIPLELYFDHRNYLASAAIIALAYFSCITLLQKTNKTIIRFMIIFSSVIFIANLCVVTLFETRLWKDEITYSLAQMEKRPESERAYQTYASVLFNHGHYAQSIQLIEIIHEKFGIRASNAIYQVALSCISFPDNPIKHETLINDLRTLPPDNNITDAMDMMKYAVKTGGFCASLDANKFSEYALAILANKEMRKHHHNIAFLLMEVFINQKEYKQALDYSLLLPKRFKSPQYLIMQIHLALSVDDIDTAGQLIQEIDNLDRVSQIANNKEIDRLLTLYETAINKDGSQ